MTNHEEFAALNLTEQQRSTNFETMLHIENVRHLLQRVREDLARRANEHDQSKLRPPEVAMFAEFTGKLRDTTYGSADYKQCLKDMGPALQHHYEHNTSHHPEGNPRGIDGMNLLDLVEMLCDWKAATLRHANGDLGKSVTINAERFGMSEQLTQVLRNTVKWMEKE